MAALLPDFLVPGPPADAFLRVNVPAVEASSFQHRLAWTPRLLRLNPHASRCRDFLIESLAAQMRKQRAAARSSSTRR